MMRKVRNIAMIMIVIVSMIYAGCVIPTYASTDKTLHVAYYLTDDNENYINWDGERIDPEQRILIEEETFINKYNEGQRFYSKNQLTYHDKTLYVALGLKTVKYKDGHCEMMFGVYMDNLVTYMDWIGATDHSYVKVDDKPVRFPYNLGYEAKAPSAKEGYTFIDWYDENGVRFEKDSIIKEDMSVYAKYVENTQKKEYLIHHYTEDLNGQYSIYETEKKEAEDGQEILADKVMKTGLTGFHFNPSKSDQAIVVGQDQALHIYYDRDIKTVTFMNDTKVEEVQNVKYEGKASTPPVPLKEGYKFIKWNTRQDGTGRDFDINTQVVYDSVYYAIFETVPAYQYTIHYYLEQENGYEYFSDEMKSGFEGLTINATEEQKQLFEGYQFNDEKSDKNVIINQEHQIISFYYDRIEYPYIIEYYYDGILDENHTETGVAYLHDVINEFQDKNKEGFTLINQPSLIIGKDQNILKVEYARQEFEVRFFNKDNQVLATEYVKYGDSAKAPIVPEITGMHFIGWDQDFSRITSSLDIHAQYAVNTYLVEFQDMNGNVMSQQQVQHGQDATLPIAPVEEGYEFVGWVGNYQNVQRNEIVMAQYRKVEVIIPPIDNPDDMIPPTQNPNETPDMIVPDTILPTTPTVTPPQSNQTEPSVIAPEQTPVTNNDQTNSDNQAETTPIEDQETPLAQGKIEKQWALINLIALGFIIILSMILLLSKKEKTDEDNEKKKRRTWSKVLAMSIAFLSTIIFLLTENIFLKMALTDQYTIVMLGLALLQIVVFIVSQKYKDNGQQKQVVIN